MNILVTGASGFVGKNLVCALRALADGRDRGRESLRIDEIFSYDLTSTEEELRGFCEKADFVFHLAGVNRPKDEEEFFSGNLGFTETLLNTLKKVKNPCPILLSSSVQATLVGRYDAPYGKSKRASENALFSYAEETGANVFVFRFPNLFGKWCRANYNSVVATFCHNRAHDLPLTVNDESTELELLYIDDLICAMLDVLEGNVLRCEYNGLVPYKCPDGRFCFVENTHRVTLGEIARLLDAFAAQPNTLLLPEMKDNSFTKKLYSTYLSYLPKEKIAFDLVTHTDARGSFTEFLKTPSFGQVSVNVSRPGITKGEHFHHTKWEFFLVVHGEGLMQMRNLDTGELHEFQVSGKRLQAVHMPPGYTHNLINLSDTEDLITVMWANEAFDPSHPDTFYEKVKPL